MDGADVIKIVGTNGCRKVSPIQTYTNAQYPFYRDSMLVNPNSDDGTGKPLLEENTTLSAYDDVVTVCFETVHDVKGKKSGVRLPVVSFSNPSFAEANDINKVSLSGMRLSDVRFIDKYLIDGNTAPDVVATAGTAPIYNVNVDYLIIEATGGAITATGTIGQLLARVNTTNGKVDLYKHNGTNWTTTAVTSTLGKGMRIFSENWSTSLAHATPTTANVYVIVKTAGTTGNAVATPVKLGVGTGIENYLWKVKDFKFETALWYDYVTIR